MAGAIAVGIAVAPPAQAAPSTSTTTSPTTGASVYYPNCKAACADGVAPIYRGQPGYRPGLDRDGDGIACEVCH
ncbi:excalibur calcium-binding domain-containing protein [Mycobacterium seoulense]|uniref:excalibur calcium-binding domain-containing protein n=1 Tax=Mycobacterium seoulense TaxID=386911 RepID=UPI003CF05001